MSGEIKKTDAMAYCISKTEEKNALWWTIFDSCIINESEDGVTITLRHGNRQILEDEKVIDFLKTQMKLLFSVDEEIHLAEDEIEVTHELKPIFAQTAQEKPQAPKEEGVVIGKTFIPDDITPIIEVNTDIGNCVIHGNVFNIDMREITKIKKHIISFYITICI